MNENRFLEYSSIENMSELRAAFNRGKNLEKLSPTEIPIKHALNDVEYFQFVIEQGYSGYTYFDKKYFNRAFEKIIRDLSSFNTKFIATKSFSDIISKHLSFLNDGHLSISCNGYGIGFYKKFHTYVADMVVQELDKEYFTLDTNEKVNIEDKNVRLFKTISKINKAYYLIGIRCYEELSTINVCIDGEKVTLPVHKIKSNVTNDNILLEAKFNDNIAYVKSSSFVGDNKDDLERFFEVGMQCSKYNDVIWNLSNNLGGNSEFASQFIKGLNGACKSGTKTYRLQSPLIHAKETGEIIKMPYTKELLYENVDEENAFKGRLHVIINNNVASSGENAILMAKEVMRTKFYGCNTLGIGQFGDLLIYYLPYSQMTIWCPHKVFESCILETVGYEPDYWIDSSEPVNYVMKFINQEKE